MTDDPIEWTIVATWSHAHVLRSPYWTLCGRYCGRHATITLSVGAEPVNHPRCGQCLRRDPYFEVTR